MRHFNSMDRSSYFLSNYIWTVVLVVLFREPLYDYFGTRYLPDWKVLLAVLVAGVVGGMLLTMKRYRNVASVLINILLGFSVCLTAAVWTCRRPVALVAMAAAAVTVVGYMAFVLIRYRRKRCVQRRASLSSCLYVGLINGRTLLALVLTMTMTAGLFLNAASVSVAEDRGKMTIGGEAGTLRLLEDDVWPELSEAERLEVLQTIADIEADYLGMDRIRVEIGKLGETTLGCYNDAVRCITINRDWLEEMDGFETLEVLCHECFHAYQHRVVDLYMEIGAEHRELLLFRDADRYCQEFDDYVDGDEDYDVYAAQRCEIDSIDYAAEAVQRYWNELQYSRHG